MEYQWKPCSEPALPKDGGEFLKILEQGNCVTIFQGETSGKIYRMAIPWNPKHPTHWSEAVS